MKFLNQKKTVSYYLDVDLISYVKNQPDGNLVYRQEVNTIENIHKISTLNGRIYDIVESSDAAGEREDQIGQQCRPKAAIQIPYYFANRTVDIVPRPQLI